MGADQWWRAGAFVPSAPASPSRSGAVPPDRSTRPPAADLRLRPPGRSDRPGRVLAVLDGVGTAARVRDLADLAGADVDVRPAHATGPAWPSSGPVLVDVPAARQLLAAGRLPPQGPTVVLLAEPADLAEGDASVVADALCAARVVRLPEGERWLITCLADAAEPDGVRAVLVAVQGCSPAQSPVDSGLVAAALARAAAARLPPGERCLAMDAAPTAAGIDLRMCAESLPGARWPDMDAARGRLPAGFLSAHLPTADGVVLLSGDRSSRPWPGPQACDAVLAAARRGFALVVADLGVERGLLQDSVLDASDHVVLVVPPGVAGVASAAHWLRERAAHLHERPGGGRVHALMVRGGRDRGAAEQAVRQVLTSTGVPLASWVPVRTRRADRRAALGSLPPGRRAGRGLGGACAELLAAFAESTVPGRR